MKQLLYAMLIGLDAVDPGAYPEGVVLKDLGPTAGSAMVAKLSEAFTTYYGANVTIIPPRSSDVHAAFTAMQGVLKAGDVLVCAYVGHGLFLETTGPTVGNLPKAVVGKLFGDYNWTTAMVLADYLMLAAEFNRLLGAFGPGITVLNIVDCCVSGVDDYQRVKPIKLMKPTEGTTAGLITISPSSNKISQAIYALNKARYDAILTAGPGTLQVSGLQFAASRADKEILVSSVVSPFSKAISDAITYNALSSYADLNTVVAGYKVAGNYDPVMYAFGEASTALMAQPLFNPNPRLKAPLVAP